MTHNDVEKDCARFIEYLQANGKLTVALILEIVDDKDNTIVLCKAGNNEQVIDAALAAILDVRGMKAVYK